MFIEILLYLNHARNEKNEWSNVIVYVSDICLCKYVRKFVLKINFYLVEFCLVLIYFLRILITLTKD